MSFAMVLAILAFFAFQKMPFRGHRTMSRMATRIHTSEAPSLCYYKVRSPSSIARKPYYTLEKYFEYKDLHGENYAYFRLGWVVGEARTVPLFLCDCPNL